MSRRKENSPPAEPCPCGLPAPYAKCCGWFHAGEPVPSAEQLMRSRYSAFVLLDEAYLLRSWHPDTRPDRIGFDPGMRWTGLEILGTTDGTPFHTNGTVTFRAHFRLRGRSDDLHEQSRFVRHDGAWVYFNAVFTH